MSEKSGNKDSMKTEVIEILFRRLWPEGSSRPDAPMIVKNDDVVHAIRERNAQYPDDSNHLSTNNPANFLKDFIRHTTCNGNWPRCLWDKRITARQRYGDKMVMEFIDWREGDDRPFPDRYDPVSDMDVLAVEALSIPREARALGREDEPWLIQVVVGQRIIHTHLAVVAAKAGLNVVTLAHLQTSVKTQPEIDATFVATVRQTTAGQTSEIRAYLVGEAKQIGERILEDQIREQVAKAFEITAQLEGSDAIDAVIPVAIKVIRYPLDSKPVETKRGIYVAQFTPILRSEFNSLGLDNLHDLPLVLQSRAFYTPFPPVSGISYEPLKKKTKGKGAKGRSDAKSSAP